MHSCCSSPIYKDDCKWLKQMACCKKPKLSCIIRMRIAG